MRARTRSPTRRSAAAARTRPSPAAPRLLASPLRPPRSEGLYHCDYCHKDLSSTLRVKCAACKDFDLCLECFRCARAPLRARRTGTAAAGCSEQRRWRGCGRPRRPGRACLAGALPARAPRVAALSAATAHPRRTPLLHRRRSVGVSLNVAGHSSDHPYKVVQSLGFPLYHPAWRVSAARRRRAAAC